MAEIKMVSCGNCGYEWQQGRDGNHQCSEHMVRTIKRQAAEIERLRGALADSNIAAHSLASRLTGLGVRIVKDRDLIDREEVMALVVRWRSMWDDALKEQK